MSGSDGEKTLKDALANSKTILVVEDDAGDFGLIRAYAGQSGIDGCKEQVIWAKTLAEGVAAARKSRPDIVLLDLSLPDSDGLDTVCAMRLALPGVPIVVLTGYDDHALAVTALEAGAKDYLVKGQFDHAALGRAVRNAMVCEAIESRLRLFETALNSAANGIVITDAAGIIQWANPAFTQLTGYALEEALGRRPGELVKSDRHAPEFYRSMWETILSGQTWQGEIVNRRKDSSFYDETLTIAPVTDECGVIRYFVAVMQDITGRKQAEAQIGRLAFYDTLTQLPNRRLLTDRLEQAMAASQRSGYYGAVMFLDLDDFKPLNDTYGHGVGDLLLVEVARRLEGCVRKMDTVARFGGDEFVVVLGELGGERGKSALQAGGIAEKIRIALSRPYLLVRKQGDAPIEHRCTTSIGIVLFIGHEESAEDILKSADMAMYQAKKDECNSVHFFTEANPGSSAD